MTHLTALACQHSRPQSYRDFVTPRARKWQYTAPRAPQPWGQASGLGLRALPAWAPRHRPLAAPRTLRVRRHQSWEGGVHSASVPGSWGRHAPRLPALASRTLRKNSGDLPVLSQTRLKHLPALEEKPPQERLAGEVTTSHTVTLYRRGCPWKVTGKGQVQADRTELHRGPWQPAWRARLPAPTTRN